VESIARDAQHALLLEVAGTPKPGNVDRHRDHDDLRFEAFLGGAVGALDGLRAMADPARGLGEAFERSVAGMAERAETNSQFGALLALAPLVRATADGEPTPDRVRSVVAGTTVADAADFYRAFEHVDVAVRDPPPGRLPDVREGAAAVPTLREDGLTLADVMEGSTERDGIAREWTAGFPRTFEATDRIVADDGPLADRAATVYLDLLAERPDTFVADVHGEATAREVTERAREVRADGTEAAVEAFADDLVAAGVNPGTTADLVAAALFVALRRGVER
jgi:triphosphoribosyl-dephospho-CoA synthase